MAAWYTKIGNTIIQWGWQIKNQVNLQITFPTTFGTIPAVIVTSEWANGGVGCVDTIYNITSNTFNVHSCNRAPNYYVNWMAIGLAPQFTPLAPEMEDAISAFQRLTQGGETSVTKESIDQSSGQTKGAGEEGTT